MHAATVEAFLFSIVIKTEYLLLQSLKWATQHIVLPVYVWWSG